MPMPSTVPGRVNIMIHKTSTNARQRQRVLARQYPSHTPRPNDRKAVEVDRMTLVAITPCEPRARKAGPGHLTFQNRLATGMRTATQKAANKNTLPTVRQFSGKKSG